MSTVSPPFRINKQKKNMTDNEDEQETGTETEDEPVIQGSSLEHTIAPTDRVVIGRAPDDWIATMAEDFSTLTFSEVYRIFRDAVFNLEKTALVVNRMICNVRNPEEFRFSDGAMKVLTEENAGGASEFSEAVSFELFHRLFHASLVKTEMSIAYEWEEWSKKTDYTINLQGRKLAVSVTRAMKFQGLFTETDAFNLLYKKLCGIQLSNRDVLQEDRWEKQILHIMCEHVYIVDLLRTVYSWFYEKTPELIGNTVVLISLTVNAPFLYHNFCAEQSEMKFMHEERTSTSTQQTTFTTAARKDTCSAPRFGNPSGNEEEEEFFFGYTTREEAVKNNAVPIYDEETIQEEMIFDGEQAELGVKAPHGGKKKKPSPSRAPLQVASKRGKSHDAWSMEIPMSLTMRTRRLSLQVYPCDAAMDLAGLKSGADADGYSCQNNNKLDSTSEEEWHNSVLSQFSFHLERFVDSDDDCDEEDHLDIIPPRAVKEVRAASSSSSAVVSASSPLPSTKEEVIFPPVRLPLLELFHLTFQSHRQAVLLLKGGVAGATTTAGGRHSHSFPAILKPLEEMKPWSFYAMSKEEIEEESTLVVASGSATEKTPKAVDSKFIPGDTLGLAGLFNEEQ